MADAKTPTRAPPAASRRLRRDPRAESQHPPAEDIAEVRIPSPPVSRKPNTIPPGAGQHSVDTADVLAQLAQLEAEVEQLRAQNERDAATMGQMLARVADREQEAKDLRAETQRFEERASVAEARVAQLENSLADRELAASRDPFAQGGFGAHAATQDVRVTDLEEAIARAKAGSSVAERRVAELEARAAELETALAGSRLATTAAEARTAELEARVAQLDASVRETDEDRSTATEVADELAEKVETLEARLELAEKLARSNGVARDTAEERAEAAEAKAAAGLARATDAEGRASAAAADLVRVSAQVDELKTAFVTAEKALATSEERDWARAEELANARTELDAAAAHAKGLEGELMERSTEVAALRTELKSSEASLKKRHEESLAQQKSMFERQLGALEAQLGELKTAREKVEGLLKDLRMKSQEMEAEQASLEERLTFALDDRDTVSRQLEATKEENRSIAREAEEARREAARAREMLARSSLALTQLEAIERDAAVLRERALGDARAALMASMSPSVIPAPPPSRPDPTSPALTDGASAAMSLTTPSAPPSSGAAEKRRSKGPSKPASKHPPSMPAPERPAPKSIPPNGYESAGDLEISFASVAPPGSERMRAASSFAASPVRPSGRPTPPRTEVAAPASTPPARNPLSDPEIRVSIDDDEE